MLLSVEPEKLGSNIRFQPAGTESADGAAFAVARVGDGVDLLVLLAFGDALGFAVFLGLAEVLAFADGEADADSLAAFAFVNPAACGELEGVPPLRSTITATRAIASIIAPPRTPLIMIALRM